nr:nonstructural protein NS4B [Norway rat hepacivirus 2]
ANEPIIDAAHKIWERLQATWNTLLNGANPTANQMIPHLLAGMQWLAGLWALGDAPGVGVVLGCIGGYMSPFPLASNLFITGIGAAFATKIAPPRAAAAFGVAGALGAAAAVAGWGSVLCSILSAYSASTSACLVVIKLLNGQLPTVAEAASAFFALASPGGALMGAATAMLIIWLTRAEDNTWMNRLLAMLHKGTSCDNYFTQATTMRQTVITFLENANIWAVFNRLATWFNTSEEEIC